MMTLLIGNNASQVSNRHSQKGFLLMELLVCLIIFTIGWVAAFRPLARLVALEREMNFRMEANAYFSRQIWEAKDLALQAKNVNLAAGEEALVLAGFPASYQAFVIQAPRAKMAWFKQSIKWKKPGGIESHFNRNALIFLPYAI